MKPFKIYLDTSVINFLFADDAPEKKEVTIDLFDNFISKGLYDTFISNVVIAEIEDTPQEDKRKRLLTVLEEYPIENLELKENEQREVEEMAYKYVDAGIIPENKEADAYHVAISLIKRMNFLVSWNYKHLANIKKEKSIRIINLENGYDNDLRIITPMELLAYGN